MKWGGLYGLLFAVLSTVLLVSSSAKAESIFDDVVNVIEYVAIADQNGTGSVENITDTYQEYMVGNCPIDVSFAMQQYQAALETGVASVSMSVSPSEPERPTSIVLTWSNNSEWTGEWDADYYAQKALVVYNVSFLNIQLFNGNYNCYYGTGMEYSIASDDTTTSQVRPFFSTYPIEYPDDYEGQLIPSNTEPVEPDFLKPDYSWQVKTNGELTISYLKNLPHFLTGTSTFNIDKMNDNWDGIDSSVDVLEATPAGWASVTTELPGIGYYMFRVNHNQQLDVPPWPVDNNYRIEEMLVQFYWDGTSFIQGDTVGCDGGQLCNNDRKPRDSWLSGIKFPTYGLQEVVLAPLNFWAGLPSATANCQAITLNMPYLNRNISLPCLTTTVYQPNFNSLLVIWQTIMTGLVAYWVSIRIFSTIKNVDSPNNDRIEVAQL